MSHDDSFDNYEGQQDPNDWEAGDYEGLYDLPEATGLDSVITDLQATLDPTTDGLYEQHHQAYQAEHAPEVPEQSEQGGISLLADDGGIELDNDVHGAEPLDPVDLSPILDFRVKGKNHSEIPQELIEELEALFLPDGRKITLVGARGLEIPATPEEFDRIVTWLASRRVLSDVNGRGRVEWYPESRYSRFGDYIQRANVSNWERSWVQREKNLVPGYKKWYLEMEEEKAYRKTLRLPFQEKDSNRSTYVPRSEMTPDERLEAQLYDKERSLRAEARKQTAFNLCSSQYEADDFIEKYVAPRLLEYKRNKLKRKKAKVAKDQKKQRQLAMKGARALDGKSASTAERKVKKLEADLLEDLQQYAELQQELSTLEDLPVKAEQDVGNIEAVMSDLAVLTIAISKKRQKLDRLIAAGAEASLPEKV